MSILIENQNYDISIETMQGTKYVYNQNVAHIHHAVTKTTTKTITCHKYCKDKDTIQNNCHTEVINIQDNAKPLLTNHKLVFQTPQDTQHLAPTSSYAVTPIKTSSHCSPQETVSLKEERRST